MAAIILAAALPGASASAPASAHERNLLVVARPSRLIVGRSFMFAAGGVGPGVARVVFTIDGRQVWITDRRPFRYRRSGIVDTRALRNGRHVLRIEAFYRRGRLSVAQKTIIVRHRRTPPRVQAGAAGANAPSVGVIGSSPTSGPSAAMFTRFAYGDHLTTSDASLDQFIDLGYGSSTPSQASTRALIARIHIRRPHVRVLLYKAAMARPSDPTGIGACVPWNPTLPYGGVPSSWFLRDAAGVPIYNSKYDFYWLDQSNPAVQQACLDSAVSMAKLGGYDGIFFDNIAGSLYWAQIPACAGGSPTCDSDTNWQSAMESFLRYEAAGLHTQGLLAFANIGGGALTSGNAGPAIWEAYQQTGIDGAMEESFTSGTNRLPVGLAQWKQDLANEAWSEANGKYLLANADVFSSETLNTFGLATLMLAAGGHSAWDTASGDYVTGDYIFPEYATAQRLGAPAGPYRTLANGVYERPFSNGIVLVNPATSPTRPFSLGGGIYSGSGMIHVRSVAMAPTSGLILRRVG